MITRPPNKKEDIWKNIIQSFPSLCWEWNLSRNRCGYGTISIKNKKYLVHRIVYELIYGEISEGICICHHCDNPSCCNPFHLFAGTIKDNMKDKINKGRCASNKGENNGNCKLTQTQVNKIRELYSTGNYSQTELGIMFNYKPTNISSIVNNKIWSNK